MHLDTFYFNELEAACNSREKSGKELAIQLTALIESLPPIYCNENPGFKLVGVYYDPGKDSLYFEVE